MVFDHLDAFIAFNCTIVTFGFYLQLLGDHNFKVKMPKKLRFQEQDTALTTQRMSGLTFTCTPTIRRETSFGMCTSLLGWRRIVTNWTGSFL